MRTRKVFVKVFHYPLKNHSVPAMFSLFFDDLGETLDYEDCFESDRSLESIMESQTFKTYQYACNFDEQFFYRIVIYDFDDRLVKIFKA